VTDGPGREARFFAVSSGPGTPVAFTAGVVDAMEPDRLCVADSGTLAFGWLCTYEPARSFGFDAGGQFLVWSTIGGPLQVARVASAALGDPFRVEFALTGDIQGLAVGRESAVKLDAAGVATFLDLPSLTVLDTQTIGFTAGQMLVGSARRAGYERTTADTPPTDASVAATCGDRTLARSGSPDAGGAAVRHAGGDWRLALTDVAVPATATVTAAAFGENCGRLLVALEDGIGSDVLAIDIVEPGVFSARRLARRATREVAGRVRELRFDGTARGWATALVETTGDPRSLVLQRIPIERSAVLEQLEVDRHASRSSVALVAGR
jgi:hypothetical protein